MTFFGKSDVVHVVSSFSGSWQSHTKCISCILEAKFLLHFAPWRTALQTVTQKLQETIFVLERRTPNNR